MSGVEEEGKRKKIKKGVPPFGIGKKRKRYKILNIRPKNEESLYY